MNELHQPLGIILFLIFFLFFGPSLEFKCMQRSKPPFRRKRWCNKQKPPRLFTHSGGPSSSSTVSRSQSLPSEGVLPRAATRGQECSGVFFFFPPPPSFPPSSSSPSSFLLLSCLSVCSQVNAVAHAYAKLHVIMNTDFLWEKKKKKIWMFTHRHHIHRPG